MSWEEKAAQGILADLRDRREIKWGLDPNLEDRYIGDEVVKEMLGAWQVRIHTAWVEEWGGCIKPTWRKRAARALNRVAAWLWMLEDWLAKD